MDLLEREVKACGQTIYVSLCLTSVYVYREPAHVGTSYYLNNAPFKLQENTAPLTLDQVFVSQWHSGFLLLQDSNTSTMRLTTPHFKTNMHMGAQMGASTFATYTTWA